MLHINIDSMKLYTQRGPRTMLFKGKNTYCQPTIKVEYTYCQPTIIVEYTYCQPTIKPK